MNRHPVDNIALAFGIGGLVSGVFALLQQAGVITLGFAAVAAIATLVIGAGGVSLVVAEVRRR